jgi:hypothetical protein
MGGGASSASKQSVPNNGKTTLPQKQNTVADANPSAGTAMRAPWGSCVLSLHVASLFSQMDFDVSQNSDLGCMHSIALRCAAEGQADHVSGATESIFAATQRELGVLPGDVLKQQGMLFKDAAEKLDDFHEFAQTHARIFCNDHIRSTFQRKKSHFLVRAHVLKCFLPARCKVTQHAVRWHYCEHTALAAQHGSRWCFVHDGQLQSAAGPTRRALILIYILLFTISVSSCAQFGVSNSMAESAFHVVRPSEQSEAQHDMQWQEDTAYSKKFGQKSKTAKPAADSLARVEAPDFEWPQPWEQVWTQQSIPSPAAAHHLIERTNKLWESELVCSV